MNNFYSRARNMSTEHKGSFKTALTSALRIRIKNKAMQNIEIKVV